MEKHSNIPVVWQISALHLTNKRTLFIGVLLTDVPYIFGKKKGSYRNFIKIIRSYFINTYANKAISLTSKGNTINTRTDKNGSFRVITDYLHDDELEINIPGKSEPLRILQTYPITYKNTNSDIDVISDIDDTIIVSFTADLFKRVATLVFKGPKKRKPIGFTQKMFNEFNKQDARTFYISKSESNLFGVLTTFIVHNGLPKGMLFLTPYLKAWQLLSHKKGIDFKIDNISFLIENTSTKNYVLFGDDSQRDMEIYSEIAKTFPKRILKIYIRQTKPKIMSHQKQLMKNLKNTGVPIKYFRSDDDIETWDELIKGIKPQGKP